MYRMVTGQVILSKEEAKQLADLMQETRGFFTSMRENHICLDWRILTQNSIQILAQTWVRKLGDK